MQLPKSQHLFPHNNKRLARKELNRITLEFWDSWTSICNSHNIDVEIEWKRQRNYLYDLFYRARNYVRKRPVLKDNRRKNGKKPKPDLEFTKQWKKNLT